MAIHWNAKVRWQLLKQSELFRQACRLELNTEVAGGDVKGEYARLVAYVENLRRRKHRQTAFTIVVS